MQRYLLKDIAKDVNSFLFGYLKDVHVLPTQINTILRESTDECIFTEEYIETYIIALVTNQQASLSYFEKSHKTNTDRLITLCYGPCGGIKSATYIFQNLNVQLSLEMDERHCVILTSTQRSTGQKLGRLCLLNNETVYAFNDRVLTYDGEWSHEYDPVTLTIRKSKWFDIFRFPYRLLASFVVVSNFLIFASNRNYTIELLNIETGEHEYFEWDSILSDYILHSSDQFLYLPLEHQIRTYSFKQLYI
jgi:hypothetical protein